MPGRQAMASLLPTLIFVHGIQHDSADPAYHDRNQYLRRNQRTLPALTFCRVVRRSEQVNTNINAKLKIITIAGVTFASAALAFAQADMVDPVILTGAEFSTRDSTDMMTATHSIDMAMAMTEEEMKAAMGMTDDETTAMQAENDATMAAMTDDETATPTRATETSMANIVTVCSAMPDATVMDAVKAGM
jgi:hypothetical protein